MTIPISVNAAPDPPEVTLEIGEKLYRVHRVALQFPPLDDDVFVAMVYDMREHGLRRPILVTGPREDIIVDGFHRAKAALQAGIKPRFEPVPPGVDLVDVIWSENVIHRQITKSQLGIIAARRRLGAGDWPAIGDSSDEAAQQNWMAIKAGISPAHLRNAEGVVRAAPRLADAVLHDVVSVHDAHAILKYPEWHDRALAEVRHGRAKTAWKAIERLQATVAAAGKGPTSAPSPPTASTPTDDPATRPTAGGPGTAPRDAVARDHDRRPRAAPARTRSTANPGPHPGTGSSGPRMPAAPSPPAAGHDAQQTVGSDAAILPSEIAPSLRTLLGYIDMAYCSASAQGHGVKARHWHEPADADLNVPWDGSVLAVPPLALLDAFVEKLIAEFDAGRVVRAVLLAPLDPTHSHFDRVLDAERLQLAGFERRARASRSESAASATENPRTALYLFSTETASSDLIAALEQWGHVLLPRRSNSSFMAKVEKAATAARGLWNKG